MKTYTKYDKLQKQHYCVFFKRMTQTIIHLNKLTLYKLYLEESVNRSISFNCRIPDEKLSTYNQELIRALFKDIKRQSPLFEEVKQIFVAIKEENQTFTTKKKISFNQKYFDVKTGRYHQFPQSVKIEVENFDQEIPGRTYNIFLQNITILI